MNEELKKRIDKQDQMIGRIYSSVEKTRKYFLWIIWGTVVMFIIPLVGILIIIPKFISTFTDQMGVINSLGL